MAFNNRRSISLLESEKGQEKLITFLKDKGIVFPLDHEWRVLKRLTVITIRLGFDNFDELLNRLANDRETLLEITDWLERGKIYNEEDGSFSPLVYKKGEETKNMMFTESIRQKRKIKPKTHNITHILLNSTIEEQSTNEGTFIGLGEMALGHSGELLKIASLGSCIGLVFYPNTINEPEDRLAIMAHIMLPIYPSEKSSIESPNNLHRWNPMKRYGPAKYADKAIPLMIKILEEQGYHQKEIEAKMVGGAKMFGHAALTMEIGFNNQKITRKLLKQFKIPISGYYTGGDTGMSVTFAIKDYQLIVKPTGGSPIII